MNLADLCEHAQYFYDHTNSLMRDECETEAAQMNAQWVTVFGSSIGISEADVFQNALYEHNDSLWTTP